MAVNKETLELIKHFEGFRGTAYKDVVGVWTIGYGHTNLSGQPPKVSAGTKMTEPQASRLLVDLLDKVYEPIVKRNVKVPLNENQYGALVSWCYNLGETNFKKSTLLRKLNAGDYRGAADEFHKWNRAGGKVYAGLTRRRKAEADLFMKGTGRPVSTKVEEKSTETFWDLLKKIFSAFGKQ